MIYDSNNIFAKILRGEIPSKLVYENEYALAFHDIAPQAPVHVLVIPKGAFASHQDFVGRASPAEITGFEQAVGYVARLVDTAKSGYRLISNNGSDAHQEVPHYHVHILGGRALGAILVNKI
jgi:histidine triad (HIT) family protein